MKDKEESNGRKLSSLDYAGKIREMMIQLEIMEKEVRELGVDRNYNYLINISPFIVIFISFVLFLTYINFFRAIE